MSRFLSEVVVLLLCAAGAAAARADEYDPYVYQRAPGAGAAAVRVESETAVGTRDARPFGDEGVEQAGRVELRAGRWSFAVRGGALVGGGAGARGAARVEGGVVLRDTGGVRVSVGGAVGRDYRGDMAARVSLTGGATAGRWNLSVTGIGEKPFASGRDAVDVIVGVGASARVGGGVRLGAEVVGEDLEDAWEDHESEGGARLLVGPTLSLTPDGLDVKASAAATQDAGGTGFLGRVVVGKSF